MTMVVKIIASYSNNDGEGRGLKATVLVIMIMTVMVTVRRGGGVEGGSDSDTIKITVLLAVCQVSWAINYTAPFRVAVKTTNENKRRSNTFY